jgi:hypothetical protein
MAGRAADRPRSLIEQSRATHKSQSILEIRRRKPDIEDVRVSLSQGHSIEQDLQQQRTTVKTTRFSHRRTAGAPGRHQLLASSQDPSFLGLFNPVTGAGYVRCRDQIPADGAWVISKAKVTL